MVKLRPAMWSNGISKKKLIVIFAVVLLLAGLSVGGWYAYRQFNSATQSESDKYNSLSAEEKAIADRDVYLEAVKEYEIGTYDEALKIIDRAMSIRTLDTDKASMYYWKATFCLNAKIYYSALEYANEAEKLNPTDLTASLLGLIYYSMGQYQISAEKYELAAGRTQNPNNPNANSAYNDYIMLKKQSEVKLK